MKFCLIIGLLGSFASFRVFAQGDAKDLEPIVVTRTHHFPQSSLVYLPKNRIDRLLATDASQLLLLFPGQQLKSYGGLGGMKTVTFRSLGAGHTSVVSDHFALSQTQSGQTDLGQIPVDFIQQFAVVSQAGASVAYPIHAKLAGQIIAIQTLHLPSYADTFQVRAGVQIGSFGQADAHFFVGKRVNKWRFALSGKGRRFDGDYPFSYTNGFTTVKTIRNNGDLRDVFGTASVTYQPNDAHQLHLSYSGAGFDKGLPGAVVFYNESAGQRLYGQNHLATLRHFYHRSRWEGSTAVAFQQNTLDYVDSNYLNAQGYLHSHYRSQQSEASSQWSYELRGHTPLLAGGGVRHERLFSDAFSLTPTRLSIDGIVASNIGRIGLYAQVGLQSIRDIRPNETRQTFALLPSLEWKHRFTRNTTFFAGYRYTQRQPSFNELYYNQVGNDDLRPEKAHLGYLRLENDRRLGEFRIRTSVQPFYVYATDKILAIPTKNLFIWSIQNIGKSQAFGAELIESIFYRLKNATLALNLNYTYQYTQDLSDPESVTYGHELSYSPQHSGTAELSFERLHWGVSTLLTYQGARYALNENIPANLLDDFLLLDCSAFYRFKFKRHQLTVRGAFNNITNNYYSYIRYFVMPGRNFTLRLSYAF